MTESLFLKVRNFWAAESGIEVEVVGEELWVEGSGPFSSVDYPSLLSLPFALPSLFCSPLQMKQN